LYLHSYITLKHSRLLHVLIASGIISVCTSNDLVLHPIYTRSLDIHTTNNKLLERGKIPTWIGVWGNAVLDVLWWGKQAMGVLAEVRGELSGATKSSSDVAVTRLSVGENTSWFILQ